MYSEDAEAKPARRKALTVAGWILFALLFLGSIASRVAEPTPAYASGQILAQTAILCAVLYFTALRGASWWKAAAAFAPVFIVITLATLVKAGGAMSDIKKDVGTLTEFSYDKDGNVVIPEGAENNGPIAATTAKMARANAALLARFEDEVEDFGALDMMSASKLAANPAILKRCSEFPLLKQSIASYEAEQIELINKTKAEFAAMDMPETMKRGMLEGMERTVPQTLATNARFWALNAELVDLNQRACETLAKRRWRASGDVFEFYSEADLASYNRVNNRMIEVDAEMQRNFQDHIARQTERTNAMKREFGPS